MPSLADLLGVSSLPDVRGAVGQSADGPLADVSPLELLSGKQFAEALLRSPEFRTYIVNGMTLGDIPPAVLCRLMDHGWGKPPEHIEVKDTTNRLESLTVEQLESRALFLADVARRMRADALPDEPGESVH